MPLSWNEIKSRALGFSREWQDESSEDAEAKSFRDGFFSIFGISRKRLASFEEPVKKLGDKQGFIDLFWKGVLLVEHKSRGKSLDKAYTQALDYFPGIAERDLPQYVLVSDFVRFRLYDLDLPSPKSLTPGPSPSTPLSNSLPGGERAMVPLSLREKGGGEGEPEKTIFEYEDIKGDPHAIRAANINPYLVDAPDVVLPRRSKPICDVPEIGIGNKPIDGGQYLFTPEEKAAFLAKEPAAAPLFRRWIGAEEFINGHERWCLWLGDCPPEQLRAMPEVMKRVQAVKALRLASKSAPTRKLADTPTRFHVENMPTGPYLVLPEVSSERRLFIPIGYEQPETFASNLVKIAPNATLFHFGILTSTMHNAWVRAVCGRLKSDYRYSASIVYNNFSWPDVGLRDEAANPTYAEDVANVGRVRRSRNPTPARAAIEAAAQGILDARALYMTPSPAGGRGAGGEGAKGSTLADLYDPLTMPPALLKAHQALDKAVDAAYGKSAFKSEAERVAFLFERYQKLTSLLPAESRGKARKAGKTPSQGENA